MTMKLIPYESQLWLYHSIGSVFPDEIESKQTAFYFRPLLPRLLLAIVNDFDGIWFKVFIHFEWNEIFYERKKKTLRRSDPTNFSLSKNMKDEFKT